MGYFKYTESRYLENMLNKGTLRIGTLYEYRVYDQKEIQDENEGKATVVSKIIGETQTFKTSADLPEKLRSYFRGNSFRDLTLGNITISNSVEVENAYIYCLCKKPLKWVMEHFEYDACVEITDIIKFSVVIAVQLYLAGLIKFPFGRGEDCIYRKREYSSLNNKEAGNIYWLKEERFSRQQEYRIVMLPTDLNKATSFNYDFPDLRDCLREVKL